MTALAVLYGVHLWATAVWVGALVGLVYFAPAHEPWDVLWRRHRRVDLALWASLAALWATGMFQMSASTRYEGLLQVHSLWAAALLLKHGLVLAIMAGGAYHTLHLLPALRRRAWQARRNPAPDDPALRTRLRTWSRVQLALAAAVLLVTAVVRAAA